MKPVSNNFTIALDELLEKQFVRLNHNEKQIEEAIDCIKWFFDELIQNKELYPSLKTDNIDDIVDEMIDSIRDMDTTFLFQQYFYVSMFMRELMRFMHDRFELDEALINGLDISSIGNAMLIEYTLRDPP